MASRARRRRRFRSSTSRLTVQRYAIACGTAGSSSLPSSGNLPPVSNEGTGRVGPVRRGRHQARPLRGDHRRPSQAPHRLPEEPRARGRFTPAVLDAVFPGLGHLAAGRRQRAAMFGLPILVLIGLLLGILATTSFPRLAATLSIRRCCGASSPSRLRCSSGDCSPSARACGIHDSAAGPPRRPPDRGAAAGRGDRTAGICRLRDRGRPRGGGPDLHGAVADRRRRTRRDPRTRPELPPPGVAQRVPRPRPPSPTPAMPRDQRPARSAWTPGIGRNTYLTDTMIVASLDPIDADRFDGLDPARHGRRAAARRAQVHRARSTASSSYARHHPRQFPGADGTGFDVLDGRARRAARPRDRLLRDRQPRRAS